MTPTPAAADPAGDPGNVQTLAPPHPSQVDLDERFLDDLGLGGIRVTNVKEVIGDAHQICATLKAGETEQQIIKLAISQNATLTEGDAQTPANALIPVRAARHRLTGPTELHK